MLTVLMATHNGAATLARVLTVYLDLATPPGGWQLVVVDNASCDQTPAILANFADRLPLTALRTEQRGKNIALNLGLAHLAGDLVVLTDDDALPAPDWLSIWRQVADQQRDYDIFGGRIDPVWPAGLPEWIPRLVNLGATYAITPEGLETGAVPAGQIWGPNMAVRASVFAAGHRFNEAVGPQAGQYMMGSEVEFTCRLEHLGHRAWFSAEAIVGHIIRPNQIDREWIIKRAYRLGRHMFHQEKKLVGAGTPMFRGAPRWRYGRLLSEYGRLLAGMLTQSFDQKFSSEWEISFLQGYLTEARISGRD